VARQLVLMPQVALFESPYFSVLEDLVGMALVAQCVVQGVVEVFTEWGATCFQIGLELNCGCMACNA